MCIYISQCQEIIVKNVYSSILLKTPYICVKKCIETHRKIFYIVYPVFEGIVTAGEVRSFVALFFIFLFFVFFIQMEGIVQFNNIRDASLE